MASTLEAFPKAPSFAYVAGDASAEIGKVILRNKSRAQEADPYLKRSINWLDQSGIMSDISIFSENFAAYCGAYQKRIDLLGVLGQTDEMLSAFHRMQKSCSAPLERYPWDFWLRLSVLEAWHVAGQHLLEAKRYAEAEPYLLYASEWGVEDATVLRARVQREGLGVPKDEAKAAKLDELAKGQGMKQFTIPVDFGGTKIPVFIYVREWPESYRKRFPGVEDQRHWLKEARGGVLAPEVVESFAKLQKIAEDNHVSFPELCAYALSTVDKDANTKALETARAAFEKEHSTANLEAWKAATAKRIADLVNDKKSDDVAAVEKQLADGASELLKSVHDAAAYRLAWGIFFDRGERNESIDPTVAAEAFARSADVSELLPQTDPDDLYKRARSFSRLGELHEKAGKPADARVSFEKAASAARQRFSLKPDASNFGDWVTASNRLYQVQVELKQPQAGMATLQALTDPVESLFAKQPNNDVLMQADNVYFLISQASEGGGESVDRRRYQDRLAELSAKLSLDSPDTALMRALRLEFVAGMIRKRGDYDKARTIYRDAAKSYERYAQFRTASPPQKATWDQMPLYQVYGTLSWLEVLAGDFSKGAEAANNGLKLQPDAAYIEANLAHTLLLSGKEKDAIEHYMKVRKSKVDDRPMIEATAEDFSVLKQLGFSHPAMDSILKRMLEP